MSKKVFAYLSFVLLILQLQLPLSLSESISDKVEYAKELLQQLKEKSGDLDWKVCDIQQVVEDFKCGFKKLEEDVTLLEGAKAQVKALKSEYGQEIEQHNDESEDVFDGLLSILEDKKEVVDKIEEFAHPCGGYGWKRVEYKDFRDPDTDCYDELMPCAPPISPHLCCIGVPGPADCSRVIISVDGEYSAVCGRIKAYQYGTGDAFNLTIGGNGINEAYLSGISLTHGGDLGNPTGENATHIWSFAIGQTQFQMVGGGAVDPAKSCPCDGGAASPLFVGEDYFCDTRIIDDISSDPTRFNNVFFNRKPLWNGEGCIASSTCCSRIDHPYFIKYPLQSTTDDIDLRVCITDDRTVEDIGIELVDLYVQYVPST